MLASTLILLGPIEFAGVLLHPNFSGYLNLYHHYYFSNYHLFDLEHYSHIEVMLMVSQLALDEALYSSKDSIVEDLHCSNQITWCVISSWILDF